MPVLIALTVLVGLLALINLALTMALVKRVREHDAKFAFYDAAEPATMAAVGERVDDFATTTLDGETLTRDSLTEGTLVGFFDPQCETCHENLPKWTGVAKGLPGGREQALAVIREDDDQDEMVALAVGVARVVVERRRGPVARAFHVKAIPSYCVLGPDQVVAAHGYDHAGAAPR